MTASQKPVAIITGASSGIGLATARLLASSGYLVVGTVRGRRGRGQAQALPIDLQPADMTRPGDLERVVQTAWRTYGRIDALILNAGYGLAGPIDSLSYAQMRDQLVVNTLAPAELVRQVVPLMRRRRDGVIVGVSGYFGRVGVPGMSLLSASKFGLEGLLEAVAAEVAESGVRVKLVEPSGVNTSFWTSLKGKPELVSRLHALSAEQVARGIARVIEDRSSRLRYPLGKASWQLFLKRILPERLYRRLVGPTIV